MLAIGAVLLHGVPACLAGGDEQLNPQPLPPEPPPDSNGPPTSGENSSGSSSGGAAPTGPFADAGTSADGDAGVGATTSDGGDQ